MFGVYCDELVTDTDRQLFGGEVLHIHINDKAILFHAHLTVSIVRPVEPAHERRAYPGEGPGEGPEQGPVSERFCQGEVRMPMWVGPTVPGILDGNIHDEVPGEMEKRIDGYEGDDS